MDTFQSKIEFLCGHDLTMNAHWDYEIQQTRD
jgi:hypothetical protein